MSIDPPHGVADGKNRPSMCRSEPAGTLRLDHHPFATDDLLWSAAVYDLLGFGDSLEFAIRVLCDPFQR